MLLYFFMVLLTIRLSFESMLYTWRSLEVYTTEPGVQVYTANWHNGFTGYHGATFPARSAICFEAQHFPDSPNKGHFPSVVLKPEDTYHQVTIYKFGVEK